MQFYRAVRYAALAEPMAPGSCRSALLLAMEAAPSFMRAAPTVREEGAIGGSSE